jgi:hypothetical protein
VLAAEKEGKPQHEIVLDLGPTPAPLITVGFNAHPMRVGAKVIGKMFFDHGMTQTQIEKIPAMLSQPKAIFNSATQQDGSVVVLTFEIKAGHPIIITVARDRKIGRDIFNIVTSMYAKTGPNVLSGWKNAGLLRWGAC